MEISSQLFLTWELFFIFWPYLLYKKIWPYILHDHIFCMIMVTNAILCPIISFCMQTERETRYCYKRTDSFQDKCLLHDQQDHLDHHDHYDDHDQHDPHDLTTMDNMTTIITFSSSAFDHQQVPKIQYSSKRLVQHKGALLSSLVYIIYASDSPKHWRAYNSEWLFSGRKDGQDDLGTHWPSCLAMDRKSTCLSLRTNALKNYIESNVSHCTVFTHSVHFNGIRWH